MKQEYNENEKQNNEVYAPIIKVINYWIDSGKSTVKQKDWRLTHDHACLLTNNIRAKMIFSLWLPLRYTLMYHNSNNWQNWIKIKNAFYPNTALKNLPIFLAELKTHITEFLPQTDVTLLLSEFFKRGWERSNIFIQPDFIDWKRIQSLNYFEYFPSYLYDILDYCCAPGTSPTLETAQQWIRKENLEMFFFTSEVIDKNHLKDLAGTGDVCNHKVSLMVRNIEQLLTNYIGVLRQREKAFQ